MCRLLDLDKSIFNIIHIFYEKIKIMQIILQCVHFLNPPWNEKNTKGVNWKNKLGSWLIICIGNKRKLKVILFCRKCYTQHLMGLTCIKFIYIWDINSKIIIQYYSSRIILYKTPEETEFENKTHKNKWYQIKIVFSLVFFYNIKCGSQYETPPIFIMKH